MPQYQVNFMVRFVNRLMAGMIRMNMASPTMYLLTVHGRKTGKTYSAPVTLILKDDQRWLVSPYGEVNWVKNARAAGEVTLAHGNKIETVKIHESDPKQSAPILKEYITQIGIVRPYFNAQPDSALEAFEAEATGHPVFLLESR